MSIDLKERNFDVENLPAIAQMPAAPEEVDPYSQTPAIESRTSIAKPESEPLAALFVQDVANEFRAHWDAVQGGFVDDPRQAVRQADALVARVMTSLAETFTSERAKLEGQVDPTDKASTEDLRVALRRYRSFFERLLSL
jgi:hypothetical protein